MKFTIEKNIMLEALTNVTRALSQKTTIPVLNGIKFSLKKDGLTLIGSDSDLTIKVFLPEMKIMNTEETGECILQSKSLLELIKKMPSDVINFCSTDSTIQISTESNEYNLNCYELKDYPDFNIKESNDFVQTTSKDFKIAIDQTSYALSTQEIRPILTGTNIISNKDELMFISTDSYRLSKKVINVESHLNEDINIVLPGRTMHELSKIINEEEQVIKLNFFPNKIVIIYNNITIQSNLLSGTFPDTSHFIPDDFAYIINLNLREFYNAIDRASLISSNKDKNIIKLDIKDKEMLITSANEEIGRNKEHIIIDSNKKERLNISMNSKYLLDTLRVVREDDILLLINSEDKPVVIKAVSDEKLTGLILPIQNY